MMKKKTIWLTATAAVVGLAFAVLYLLNGFVPVTATTEQASYLPDLLRQTRTVVIRQTAKDGGQVFATISDPAQVKNFVSATRITHMEAPCACFGHIDVDYVDGGHTNRLNYSVSEGYIKYSNPWFLQAKAPSDFRRLVAGYLAKPQRH